MPDKIEKVSGLVKVFEDFALFVKKKWRATFLAIFILAMLGGIFLILFYGYRKIELLGTDINKSVEILEENHKTPTSLQKGFIASVAANQEINVELTRILTGEQADAAIMFKFHNTKTDLQGRHDFFYSATNEALPPEDSHSFLPDAQDVPIVRLGKYVIPFLEKKCQIVDIDDMDSNTWLKNKLNELNIHVIITCPIYDRTNRFLIGFSELVYLNGTPIPEEMDCTILDLSVVSKRISIIISE